MKTRILIALLCLGSFFCQGQQATNNNKQVDYALNYNFKPVLPDKVEHDGGDVNYSLYGNEKKLWMYVSYFYDRTTSSVWLYDLHEGILIDSLVAEHVGFHEKRENFRAKLTTNKMKFIMPLNEDRVPYSHGVIQLGTHELVKMHKDISCEAMINANYAIRKNETDTAKQKSLVLTGQFTFSGARTCDIITEFGDTVVSTLSLSINKVWQIQPQLFAVSFNNYPAILYLDKSMSFDNPLNEGVKIHIVDYQVIENIINNHSFRNTRLGDGLFKLIPQFTADALKQHIEIHKIK